MRKLDEYDILIQNSRLADLVKKISDQVDPGTGSVADIISSDTPFGIPTNPATSKKNPFTISIYILFTYCYEQALVGGFVDYLYNALLFILFVIFLLMQAMVQGGKLRFRIRKS